MYSLARRDHNQVEQATLEMFEAYVAKHTLENALEDTLIEAQEARQ